MYEITKYADSTTFIYFKHTSGIALQRMCLVDKYFEGFIIQLVQAKYISFEDAKLCFCYCYDAVHFEWKKKRQFFIVAVRLYHFFIA